jgi:hypothetical protein
MAAPEDADEAEVVQRNATGELRGAPGLVGAVAVVHRPAWTSHRRENLPHKKKQKQKTQISSSFGFFFQTLPPLLFSSFLLFSVTWTMDVVKKQQQKQENKNPVTPIGIYKTNGHGGPVNNPIGPSTNFFPLISQLCFSRFKKH